MSQSHLGIKTHRWEYAALAVSGLMLLGSLFLSLGMGLKACPLCLYERTFVMGVVGVLSLGLMFRLSLKPGALSLLALPMAVSGLALAGFHVHLDRSGILDCPSGVLGLGAAPDQSLAGSMLLTIVLVVAVFAERREGVARWGAAAGGATIGLVFAFASIKSAPPLPPPNPTFSPSGERILSGCEPAIPPNAGPGD